MGWSNEIYNMFCSIKIETRVKEVDRINIEDIIIFLPSMSMK